MRTHPTPSIVLALTLAILVSPARADELGPLIQSESGTYSYTTTALACEDPVNPDKWTIKHVFQNDDVTNISFSWSLGATGAQFNGISKDGPPSDSPEISFDWLGDPDQQPVEGIGALRLDKLGEDELLTSAPIFVCPAPTFPLPANVPALETILDGRILDVDRNTPRHSIEHLSSVTFDVDTGLFTYDYCMTNMGDVTLPVFWEGVTEGTVILDPLEMFTTSVVSESSPDFSLVQVQLPGIETVEPFGLVDLTVDVSEGFVPLPPSDTTLAHVASAYMPFLAALPYLEDFPTTSFDPTRWAGIDGVEINTNALNELTPPFSMDVDGLAEGRTALFDASGLTDMTFGYWWQRTGLGNSPEPGDDLVVDYEDADSNWVEIARHPGEGPDMEFWEFEAIDMPAGAFHDRLRFRFRNTSTDEDFDNFYVEDIAIFGFTKAPANDLCDNATLALDGVPNPYNITGATTDGPDEAGSCGFAVNNDVWYHHVATCDGTLTVDIGDAGYNHAVAVYASSTCPDAPDEAIACMQHPDTTLAIPVTGGQSLRIRVGGQGGSTGSATMTVTCDDRPLPCPEDCAMPSDGEVDVIDLLALLAQWGAGGSCDVTGGGVEVTDLLQMLGVWGSCP